LAINFTSRHKWDVCDSEAVLIDMYIRGLAIKTNLKHLVHRIMKKSDTRINYINDDVGGAVVKIPASTCCSRYAHNADLGNGYSNFE
jgi:hypothetical protein